MELNFNLHSLNRVFSAICVSAFLLVLDIEANAQVYFSIDTIYINNAIGVCPRNMWIEDHGIGPELDAIYHITNDSDDTIPFNGKLSMESSLFGKTRNLRFRGMRMVIRKNYPTKIYTDYPFVILPHSSIQFKGKTRLFVNKAYPSESLNYSIVNFLPILNKILPTLYANLEISDSCTIKVPIPQCYIGPNFIENAMEDAPLYLGESVINMDVP